MHAERIGLQTWITQTKKDGQTLINSKNIVILIHKICIGWEQNLFIAFLPHKHKKIKVTSMSVQCFEAKKHDLSGKSITSNFSLTAKEYQPLFQILSKYFHRLYN